MNPRISGSESTVLFLRMSPPWSFINDIRTFVEAFCRQACNNRELEQRFALATHELMQNAVSYSLDRQAEIYLKVDPSIAKILLSVSNKAVEAEIARFRERIEEMNTYQDSLAYYLFRMKLSVGSKERAGLGLARIWHEAQFHLAVKFHDNRVAVEVSSPMDASITTNSSHTFGVVPPMEP